MARDTRRDAYWTPALADLLSTLGASASGLASAEALNRLQTYGPNRLSASAESSRLGALWRQLRSPLVLLLAFAVAASAATGEWLDAMIISAIIIASAGLGSSREYRAERAAAQLSRRVRSQARVLRGGAEVLLPHEELVVGDVVLLGAGSAIPADGRILDANNCFVNEASLTGESFPVEKRPGVLPADTRLGARQNCVFWGTHVQSGNARLVVVNTAADTEFGAIAKRLVLRPPETEFERGLSHFGALLSSAMFVLVLLVFSVNTFLGRPPIETLLFSIALAVGLSPELLPAILAVNLSRGAQALAKRGVLVRRLNAIENLGSMNILCTDKTGTLTEGVVELEGAYDSNGLPANSTLSYAIQNATLQGGLPNPLDEAIRKRATAPGDSPEKLGEVPYDFTRKRLSVVVQAGEEALLISKGAFENVLAVCGQDAEGHALDDAARAALRERFQNWNAKGLRVLGLATRSLPRAEAYTRTDERDLCFQGFLTFLDRPKQGVSDVLLALRQRGVSVKLITGDSRLVAESVATAVGLATARVLTGRDLDELHDDALWRAAEQTTLFVEVDPNQKERIIRALRKAGHVVGFMGDGINDAPAMHAADVGISVDQATDVAREAADFVLLQRDLGVIQYGVEEGRRTFANTLKYILITTSANLGNMLSMAVASLFLPFLPLLASQVLLNNFLSDLPALGIADDRVDEEWVERPERWSMRVIGRFMVEFGALSSIFDLVTFGTLIGVFAAPPELFRTAWFVESLLTELLIAFVVRTRRPLFRSRPGTLLWSSTVVVFALALLLPYLPGVHVLGFVPLPPGVLATLLSITLLYVATAELCKRTFYRSSLDDSPSPLTVQP